MVPAGARRGPARGPARGAARAAARLLGALLALLLGTLLHAVTAADNLALLSGTLRTYTRGGCDDHTVQLNCPPGTSISVQQARYGRTPPHPALCQGRQPHPPHPPLPDNQLDNSTSCLWSEQLQYSLLQTVVEACQKKRLCQFQTSPRTFGNDPCPGVRKWVEVAYKCRPYEFRSKVACENDVVQLQCNPNARIAVYSASYGRTEYESIQCPQPQRVPEETCLTSYATETVMNICHGKRSCNIAADKDTFGSPCRPESRMYLKVVYTCVPRRVLKEEYEGRPEADEPPDEADADYEGFDNTDEYRGGAASFSPKLAGEAQGEAPPGQPDNRSAPVLLSPGTRATPSAKAVADQASSNAIPTAPSKAGGPPRAPQDQGGPGPRSSQQVEEAEAPPPPAAEDSPDGDVDLDDLTQINCTVTIFTGEKQSPPRVIGVLSEWINTYSFMRQNQEKLYLYLTLSVSGGLLLFLALVVGRLLVQRHRARSEAKFRAANAAPDRLPNGFADDISEIDADIDLTTPVAVPVVAVHSPPRHEQPAEVVRYGGTLRRGVGVGGGAGVGVLGGGLPVGGLPADLLEAPRSLNRGGGPNQQYFYG